MRAPVLAPAAVTLATAEDKATKVEIGVDAGLANEVVSRDAQVRKEGLFHELAAGGVAEVVNGVDQDGEGPVGDETHDDATDGSFDAVAQGELEATGWPRLGCTVTSTTEVCVTMTVTVWPFEVVV